jgi:hypothetical protein
MVPIREGPAFAYLTAGQWCNRTTASTSHAYVSVAERIRDHADTPVAITIAGAG